MRFIALALLLLASCGGGAAPANVDVEGHFIGPPPSGIVYVQAVPPGTFNDARLGEFRIDANGDGQVRIRNDILINQTLLARTVAHELGHALGVSHMGGNCVLNPDLYQQPDLALCPPEVAVASMVPGTLTVHVGLISTLQAATRGASDGWNAAVGRVVLAVQ